MRDAEEVLQNFLEIMTNIPDESLEDFELYLGDMFYDIGKANEHIYGKWEENLINFGIHSHLPDVWVSNHEESTPVEAAKYITETLQNHGS